VQIISKTGDPRFAEVYVAMVRNNRKHLIEFVDACDPRYPKTEKWVIIVSTQIGCPVGCLMCDSGTFFHGNLTEDEIFAQIDHVLRNSGSRPAEFYSHPKFKVQFARMGEPSLNSAVLNVLEGLKDRYAVKGLIPCIATTAPRESEKWFDRLAEIKNLYYKDGKFQLQFSLNSTDEAERDRFMPVEKWGLKDIAKYGDRFFAPGDRKIVLNFAMAKGTSFESSVIKKLFNPAKFIIKITPVNPTDLALENKVDTIVSPDNPNAVDGLARELDSFGFDTIVSIGAREEIEIGSNCGQSTRRIISKSQ